MNKYEISIWEDYQVHQYTQESNNADIYTEEIKGEGFQYVTSFFDERKIAVIGSDEMHSNNRACSPKFSRSVNGDYNLTFVLYTKYFDDEILEFVENPFVKLINNETKIKLHHKNKWYDFIIKQISEDSTNNSFTYTAKALYINELSKNGIDIIFDPELENDTGTINELAARALEGTDWQVGESELIQQSNLEPLYELILNEPIIAYNQFDSNEKIEIAANQTILAFYSCILNQSEYFQFLYREDGLYQIDDEDAIINSNSWVIENVKYNEQVPTFVKFDEAFNVLTVSENYRGRKFVRNLDTIYDSRVDKIVTKYKDINDNIILGYSESIYIQPEMVLNLITNGSDFTDNSGWSRPGSTPILADFFPQLKDAAGNKLTGSDLVHQLSSSELTLRADVVQGDLLLNSGLLDNRKRFVKTGIAANEKYVVRIHVFNDPKNNNMVELPQSNIVTGFVAFYDGIKEGKYNIIGDHIFDFAFDSSGGDIDSNTKLLTKVLKAKKSVSYQEMLKQKLGFFIESKVNGTLVIKQVDFFKFYQGENGPIFPETVPSNVVQTSHSFFKMEENKQATKLEEIIFFYQGDKVPEDLTPLYLETCEKKRSLKISKSNRFNIIQELCELFECWADFKIDHDDITGKIIPGSKRVVFKNYIGKDNFTGFKYGLNLKGIQRNIDSGQIVSKIVVEENSNEYATDGACSISRAIDNPTGELFFYDFRYYYTMGLLNQEILNNDLYFYNENLPWLGYYTRLHRLNLERNDIIDKMGALSVSLVNLNASHQSSKLIYNEATELIANKLQEFSEYPVVSGHSYEDFITQEPSEEVQYILRNDPEVVAFVTEIETLKKQAKLYENLYLVYEEAQTEADKQYQDYQTRLQEIKEAKDEINLAFYKKYYRFIQEGSWINEDYLDDNLYYYDAAATLAQSAMPQISYTINVIDVSSIEDFENYLFDIGDKTTIEDTEFFGWHLVNGVKTPVAEEIIISEITESLDDPSANVINVQNYKTRFEDMFQRISATTTALQYQSGGYARAANAVTSTGELNNEIFQATIDKNSFVLSNSEDQSVVWDEQGITVTSPKSPNQLVRIVNGGLYISTDGGLNWNSAITGSGINANYINTGRIDTSVIQIIDGVHQTYRWDSKGLSAYYYTLKDDNTINTINYNKYIRFDRYGLYGILKDDEWIPNSVQDVIDNAVFSLTWNGFSLKNSYNEGYLELSSTKDLVLNDGSFDRIKIGNIGTLAEPVYGIRIKNEYGASVLETARNGSLWLKNKLNISSTENEYNITLGYIPQESGPAQTFNVNNEFIVYEDGSFRATDGYFEGTGSFTGEIYATGGKIGNLTITNVEESLGKIENIDADINTAVQEGLAAIDLKELTLESATGNIIKIFKDGNLSVNTLSMAVKGKGYTTEEIDKLIFIWYFSYNLTNWSELSTGFDKTAVEISLNTSKIQEAEQAGVKLEIYDSNGNPQEEIIYPITVVRDGQDGKNGQDGKDGQDGGGGYSIEITSDSGPFFKNVYNKQIVVLSCNVYYNYDGPIEVTSYQWLKDGVEIPGAIYSTYQAKINAKTTVDNYSCKVQI